MGLYEAENTKNQNICTIPINPKEYFEFSPIVKDENSLQKHLNLKCVSQASLIWVVLIKMLYDDDFFPNQTSFF